MDDYHNVILFGAGASSDAGIPLMTDFVDRMRHLVLRKKIGDAPLDRQQLTILERANEIRSELESYHSRASFNDRNVEDLLSLLSFEALGGQPEAQARFDDWVKAIALTIELCCGELKYRAETPDRPLGTQHTAYHRFWEALIRKHDRNLPCIISFNYDLVFERALWEWYHQNRAIGDNDLPLCRLDYCTDLAPRFALRAEPCTYIGNAAGVGGSARSNGVKPTFSATETPDFEVPFLKLHGSLNWPHAAPSGQLELRRESPRPTQALDRPLILPPVFSKMKENRVASVWSTALQILRRAKHLIIVGYSLPRTDIYMQYFLKAAVGPNQNLERVFIFDPKLFEQSEESKALRTRYEDCLSPQFKNRIEFEPETYSRHAEKKGNFYHFVRLLEQANSILFVP